MAANVAAPRCKRVSKTWRRVQCGRFERGPVMLFPPLHLLSGLFGLNWDRISDVRRYKNTTRGLGGSHPVSPTLTVESGSQPEVAAPPAVLEIEDLKTYFFTPAGVVKAVDGVSYAVRGGETLGVVGESGCGKSVTALSVLRLVANPPGRIVGGSVNFEGTNLLDLDEGEMEAFRGNAISMIFQEPMTSLNPLFTVGHQIAEAIAVHQGLSRQAAMRQAIQMLRPASIPQPEQRAQSYPHQMSGGMRQRVMIAMALSCNPK